MTFEIDFKKYFENYIANSNENFKKLDLIETLELQFANAILEMAQKKPFVFLTKLNFREVENYLRPSNHVPFISSEEIAFAEKIFKKTQIALLSDISFRFLSEYAQDLSLSRESFENLGLVEKNKTIRELFIKLKILFNFIDFELVYVENNEVYVKFDIEYDSKELFQAIVNRFYKGTSNLEPLNIILVQ